MSVESAWVRRLKGLSFNVLLLLPAFVVFTVIVYYPLFSTLRYSFTDWFSNKKTALLMLIIINAWQWAGYGSVIYLAGLQTIPQQIYEAARIDGARGGATFFRITLPLLMPYITIMTFMSITGGLKLFDIPYVLTRGGPGTATETMGTVIYRVAFYHQKFGYATAISFVFFLVIAVLTILQVNFTRRREVEL